MPVGTLIVEILACSFSLWLGAYLIGRNPTKAQLYLTGLGLVAYALALAVDAITAVTLDPLSGVNLSRLHWLLVFAPALAWSGALVHLVPENHPWRTKLIHFWVHDLLPINILVLLVMAGTNLVVDFQGFHRGPLYPLFSALVILPLIGGWILVYTSRLPQGSKRTQVMLLAATLFFTLGAGLLLYPLALLPRLWILLAIGFDLLLFGWAIAALDALDPGEALLPDISRSLSASALAALVFGGQVVLVRRARQRPFLRSGRCNLHYCRRLVERPERLAATAGIFAHRRDFGWLRLCAAVAQQPGLHPRLGSLVGDRRRRGLGIGQCFAADRRPDVTDPNRKMADRRDADVVGLFAVVQYLGLRRHQR